MLRQHPQQKAPSQDQSQMSQRPTHITKIKSLHWPQLPPAGLGWWCVRFQPLTEILEGFRFFRPIGKSETPKTPNLFGARKNSQKCLRCHQRFRSEVGMMCRFFSGDGKTQRVGKPADETKKCGVQEKQANTPIESSWSFFGKNGKSPWLRVEKESTFSLASASKRKVVGCFCSITRSSGSMIRIFACNPRKSRQNFAVISCAKKHLKNFQNFRSERKRRVRLTKTFWVQVWCEQKISRVGQNTHHFCPAFFWGNEPSKKDQSSWNYFPGNQQNIYKPNGKLETHRQNRRGYGFVAKNPEQKPCLQDHPRTCKWLITMVI